MVMVSPLVNLTSYTTLGLVAIKSILNSLSIRSSIISICKRPKNPQRNPKPNAWLVSGSNDSDASFKSHCGDGGAIKTDVVKGINHFNGGQALSYARERYAYKTGDNHRVQNQQQVFTAIVDKITNDKSVLKDYDKVLDSISETYRTDLPSQFVRLIVRNQLSNMSKWTIETQIVSGTGAMDRTYSMPSVRLYVMKPDINSINLAKNKIDEYFKNYEGDINE